MQSDEFLDLTAHLRDLGGKRVWSLMISLFGDLAQGDGDVIDGPVLTGIMNMLQVKPEAARVALHRLRNDGWITSQKSGRIGRHSLTSKGRAESAAASPKIYAHPSEINHDWQLVMLEGATPGIESQMCDKGFVSLTNRLFLGHLSSPSPDNALRLTGETVPQWLPAQLEPEGLRGDYADLLKALADLKGALPRTANLSPLETAVLRCLIVHNWRRLVLKHPSLPTALVAPDWPGLACHVLVADLLEQFPRPMLRAIVLQQAAA
jgi:phenylacetic acid degradation operon negative regulatory protein